MRTGRNKYAPNAASKFYLPSGIENAFGQTTAIAYDECNMLMVSVTDPLGNTTTAVNDYRTLMPCLLTDPNGNRTAVETDALGIVVKTAAMGKAEANEGDTLDDPTAKMEYGFAEFDPATGKLLQPSWIKTLSRETHGDSNTRRLETIEYSDGMGRVALAKAKAEPDKDGKQRWVGTGRTVLNNKGNPVKQYEPYFSDTEDWENEDKARNIGVTPKMYYDPLSRLVKTEFPDDTESTAEFTAWEQKDFDRCDNDKKSPHFETPTVTHLDSLGRAFLAIANDGKDKHPTRTVLDIEGNEKKIIDARNNTVMEYRYGIHGEKGYSKSMDGGERRMLVAADGQPVYAWDSRGHCLHTEYDELRRPKKQKLSVNGGAEIVIVKTVYGENAPNPEADNLKGQPWKIYDQSGMIENARFDFKGNLLESKRQLTQEYKQTIDWNQNVLLETEEFVSETEYNALNRATNILTPSNANIPASRIMPEYDEGGLLKGVKAKLRGSANETDFVTGISYNPKGQRERIKYGNGATTKYEYDEKTFRLTRLRTFRSDGDENLQDLKYEYDPMGNIIEIKDDAQKVVFFDNQQVSPSQTFEYDALYRLVKATGREHAQNNSSASDEGGDYPQNLIQYPVPNDASALRNYTREWEYDKVGNIMELIHRVNGNTIWNRSYNYASDSNRLMSTKVSNNTAVNYTYNEHGSMASMPHLQNMQWDFAERLSHITKGSTEAYYNYDGSGQRTRKVVEKNNGNTIETRLYLGGFEIFRKKVNGNIDTERETLHIMDDTKRIALVETLIRDGGNAVNNPNPVQRYQLSNNIESATLELDDNAQIISYEEYYPYGDTSYQAGRDASEVSQKRYRYTGKEKDEESGLYYMLARYYSGWLGRWISTDPAGLVDGTNLYMYCKGNPVGLLDPEGMYSEESWIEVDENGIQTLCGRRGGAKGGFEPDKTAVVTQRQSSNKLPANTESNIYKELGKTHYDKMHEKLEKIGGELGNLIRTVWMKYEDKLKVIDKNSEKKYYSTDDEGVYINIETGAKGSKHNGDYYLLQYQSIFHEFGHMIDFLASNEDDEPYSYFYKDENNFFDETIRQEFEKRIDEESYGEFKKKLVEMPRADAVFLFDIIEGATGRVIDSSYGHEKGYWGEHDYNLSTEAFANMFSVAITNPKALKVMEDYMPKSYSMFVNILKKMAH